MPAPDPATERLADALSLAAHDLAEPLREVSGFAELLERRAEGRLTADDEALLAHVLAGARRMEGIVAGLGAYVRAERAELEVGAVEVADLLRGVDEVGEIPPVRGDARSLGDLFERLTDNARKFGATTVGACGRREGGDVVVEIADDGPGVPAGDEQRVLRLFQRAHARGEFAGAGIGLTVAAAIAARHAGSLAIERREGGGTVVRVRLPAA